MSTAPSPLIPVFTDSDSITPITTTEPMGFALPLPSTHFHTMPYPYLADKAESFEWLF
jgi:hypothetical protein